MAKILDGKETARKIREELKARCAILKEKGVVPGLAVVLVGNDPASAIYVGQKEKACAEVGFKSFRHELLADTAEPELFALVDRLNGDPSVHGILVQLPLPKGLSADRTIERIDPCKDVDGFHPLNAGLLACGLPGVVPCTPKGVMRLLRDHGIPLEGKKAVVVGRSNIVGKPMAQLLLAANMTVTVCHSRTPDLAAETLQADVLVVAAGKPGIVDGSMVKEGAVVVDVGIHRTPEGIVGDVKFDEAAERASWITPVPGGVGPLTIAMLLENTLELAERATTKGTEK
ncbi:MAG: bifunctional methylenetetrahydrofolate dehydrogenase/methenyltetrahydrofolate cyclohydrolase FolD [Synergistaceae bacterium]|nr:bifunctional methylenetetrahydrofolate dehydrogenase/methenyltetrahydrofolate cyclohydrolase FolD [Synergistaceae bacterium]